MPTAQALPQQGTIDNTSAAVITEQGNLMTIAGKDKNNILNWASFQIGKGEVVNFADKNNYMNLVRGVDISRIYGTISGGNIIYLVNPNGILFGQGARLDNVGSFVASTRNISSINKEAFLRDPGNTAAVLGVDGNIKDNTAYYPSDSSYTPKISVAEMQLTNVPNSATQIILDGPNGVILKEASLLDQTTKVLTRTFAGGGEIGIGSDTGSVKLTDEQKQKIVLLDGDKVYQYNDNPGIIQGYQTIKNIDELKWQDGSHNASVNRYMLANDIDASSVIDYRPFVAKDGIVFDGLGYEIKNLKITAHGNEDIGLYGTFNGTLRNLGLVNIDYLAGDSWDAANKSGLTGGIAARVTNFADISNVYVTGNISGARTAGGIIGNIGNDISNFELRNSHSDVNIGVSVRTVDFVGSSLLGGLIGISYPNSDHVVMAYNVYNTGDIMAYDGSENPVYISAGGIVGEAGNFNLLGAYNTGNIQVVAKHTSDYYQNFGGNMHNINIGGIGGKVGFSTGESFIGETYNLGTVESNSADRTYIGGIYGRWGAYKANATKPPIYYIDGNTRINGSSVNGPLFSLSEKIIGDGITTEEMAQIFDPAMIGVILPLSDDHISDSSTNSSIYSEEARLAIKKYNDIINSVYVNDLFHNYNNLIDTRYDRTLESLVNDKKTLINNELLDKVETEYKYREEHPQRELTTDEKFENAKNTLFEMIYEKIKTAKDEKEAEEELEKRRAFNELKGCIKSDFDFDDRVYEAFLEPVVKKIEDAKIDEYDSKNGIKLTESIYDAISTGLATIPRKIVFIGNVKYTIEYDMSYSLFGQGDVIATVTWKDKSGTHSQKMTLTNIKTRKAAEAMAQYTYGLAKLNNDVWINAGSELITAGFNDIFTGKFKDRADKAKDFVTNLVKAMVNDESAKAFGASVKGDNLKNLIESKGKSAIKTLVKDNIPGGKEIVKAAELLEKAQNKKYSIFDGAYERAVENLVNQIADIK
jgi:filamentous hemagglutinin family protein